MSKVCPPSPRVQRPRGTRWPGPPAHSSVPTPEGWAYTQRAERGQGRAARDYLLQQCECWSCQGLRDDCAHAPQHVDGPYGEYWTFRFIFHNTLMLRRTFATLSEAAATDPEGALRDVLGAKRHGAVLRAFDGREPSQVAVGMPRSLLEWVT